MKGSVKDLYGVFYVMSEGVDKESCGRWTFIRNYFLFYIDAGQVIRVVSSPYYGYTPATASILQKVDLVWVVSSILQMVIPRLAFYVVSLLVVIVAIADTLYVIHLFSSGRIEKMFPVKLLNFMVGTLVTIGFSTVIKWVFIPIECLVSSEKSLSAYLRGDDAPCTPWAYPEAIISIPTLLVAAAYMSFALIASLLTFAVNPLANKPRAQSTGRVENMWLITKIASSCLVFLAQYITAPLCNAILLALIITTMYRHLTILPFHAHKMNLIRGGVYMVIVYMETGAVVFTSIMYNQGLTPKTVPSDSTVQLLNWFVVAGIPVAYIFGVYLVHWRRNYIYSKLDRLYGECEMQKLVMDRQGGSRSGSTKRAKVSNVEAVMPAPGAIRVARRTVYDKFFDVRWTGKQAFGSSVEASTVARALLYRRDEQDLLFLNYIIMRGLEEHPYSDGLVMLHIKFLRFVFRNPMEAAAQEKTFHLSSKRLALDDRYILYALNRKAKQDSKSSTLGQDGMRAIDLMEFDAGMEKARRYHMQCVSSMKGFWRLLSRRTIKANAVDEMLKKLDDWDSAVTHAQKEYEWMLEKYQTSSQLLLTYASFCDMVLNDEKLANLKRGVALAMEGGGTEEGLPDENRSGQGGYAASTGGGSSVGESESKRLQTARYINNVTPIILGEEARLLSVLHRRVQAFVALLVLLGTCAFVFAAYFIFNDVAVADIEGIAVTSTLRSQTIECGYLTRNLMVNANVNDTASFSRDASRMSSVASDVQLKIWKLYHRTTEGPIKELFDSEFSSWIPIGSNWIRDRFNFFSLVLDFTRRVTSCAQIPTDELRDPGWVLNAMSNEKKNIAYVQQNHLQKIIGIFEKIVLTFSVQVTGFGNMAKTLVSIICSVLVVNVMMIAVLTIRALVHNISCLKYKFVCCAAALNMSYKAKTTMYKHFHDLELDMRSLEDEEMEKRNTEEQEQKDKEHGKGKSLDLKKSVDKEGAVGVDGKEESGAEGMGARRSSAENVLTELQNKKSDDAQAIPVFQVGVDLHAPESDEPCLHSSSPYKALAQEVSADLIYSPIMGLPGKRKPRPIIKKGSILSGGEDLAESVKSGKTAKSNITWEDDIVEYTRDTEFTETCFDENVVLPTRQNNSQIVKRSPSFTMGNDRFVRAEDIADDDSTENTPASSPMQSLRIPLRAETDASPSEEEEGQDSPMIEVAQLRNILKTVEENNSERENAMGVAVDGPGHGEGAIGEGMPLPVNRSLIRVSDGASGVEGDSDGDLTPMTPAIFKFPKNLKGSAEEADEGEGRASLLDSIKQRLKQFLSTVSGLFRTPANSSGLDGNPMAGSLKNVMEKVENVTGIDLTGSKHGEVQKVGNLKVGKGISADIVSQLEKALRARQEFHASPTLYISVCFVLLVLSIFCFIYPIRKVDDLVNIAATLNYASRRNFLVRTLVFLCRELVYDDGFSRLSKDQVMTAIEYYSTELVMSDSAVRVGGAFGINVGADEHNKEHNEVMYNEGCSWRARYANSTIPGMTNLGDGCEIDGMPGVGGNGLYIVMATFLDSMKNVASFYGKMGGSGGSRRLMSSNIPDLTPPPSDKLIGAYDDGGKGKWWTLGRRGGVSADQIEQIVVSPEEMRTDFTVVKPDEILEGDDAVVPDVWKGLNYDNIALQGPLTMQFNRSRYDLFASDPELKFIANSFDGDLYQGLSYIVEILQTETRRILDNALAENKNLYAIHVIAVMVCFYFFLFRRTIKKSMWEVYKTREFVIKMPLHILEAQDFEDFVQFFREDGDDGGDGDDED